MAPRTPTALQTAIFNSGQRQIVIAKKAEIHEPRLSKIANGHVEATDDEKRRIARALRLPVSDLFPDSNSTREATQ